MGENMKIAFPIKDARPSNWYGLIIIDANDIIHYWKFNGDYDGYSHNPCIDNETRINMN